MYSIITPYRVGDVYFVITSHVFLRSTSDVRFCRPGPPGLRVGGRFKSRWAWEQTARSILSASEGTSWSILEYEIIFRQYFPAFDQVLICNSFSICWSYLDWEIDH